MKIIKYPIKVLDTLADRVVAVIGAVVGSQAPALYSHYVQRLGGHLAEAERNLQGWLDIAKRVGSDGVEALAQTYTVAADPKVVAAGQKCLADLARVDELSKAMLALQNASIWSRPFVFIRNYDQEIVVATLKKFSMSLPLDIEGLVYAAIGLVLCLLLYHGIRKVGIKSLRKIRRDRQN